MSNALPALQSHAQSAADAFCQRYVNPPHRKRRHAVRQSPTRDKPPDKPRPKVGTFYRPRDHEASPFFKVVRDHFDEFEREYPEKYQERYGYCGL